MVNKQKFTKWAEMAPCVFLFGRGLLFLGASNKDEQRLLSRKYSISQMISRVLWRMVGMVIPFDTHPASFWFRRKLQDQHQLVVLIGFSLPDTCFLALGTWPTLNQA